MLRIDILTLFPDSVRAMIDESIIGRAQKNGHVQIVTHQIRDFTQNKQRQTDDYPFGGGMGVVMYAQPLFDCIAHIKKTLKKKKIHTIYLSPAGGVFTQQRALELSAHENIILVCGHYEGVDQRFIDLCVDEEISIGDFVLTGGEIPALAIADAICRLVPGVLPNEQAFTEESHFSGLLEYPQYTRPANWQGMDVPEVLLSGHHENIRKWRRKKSLELTISRRPDMIARFAFNKEDIKLLREQEK